MEERLRSKFLYKIELGLLKIMPMLLALIYLANIILSYFDIIVPALSYIGGMSLIPLIFMYISSYVFKFCEYHRMFLHYIVVNDCICLYDNCRGIPIDDDGMLTLQFAIAGITLFIILYLYVRGNKKNSTKNSR